MRLFSGTGIPRVLLVLVTLSGVVAAYAEVRAAPGATPSSAPPPPADEGRNAVVARIGPRTITAGDLEDRLASMPDFQRASYGATPAEVRRRYLDEVLVPELLLAEGAKTRHLDGEVKAAETLRRTLANATMRAVRERITPAAQISMEDVGRYYAENRSRFDTPARYVLWRILCRTREEAQTVLDAARKDGTPATFQQLARDHSLDKATFLRGGNLGFVAESGESTEAGLKVDPALVRAVMPLRDGDFAPHPVEEGPSFAVVWRRGSLPATRRAVEDAAAGIRDTLFKQRLEVATKKATDDLRSAHLKDLNEALLAIIDVLPVDGAIVPRKRPGQAPTFDSRAAGPAPSVGAPRP